MFSTLTLTVYLPDLCVIKPQREFWELETKRVPLWVRNWFHTAHRCDREDSRRKRSGELERQNSRVQHSCWIYSSFSSTPTIVLFTLGLVYNFSLKLGNFVIISVTWQVYQFVWLQHFGTCEMPSSQWQHQVTKVALATPIMNLTHFPIHFYFTFSPERRRNWNGLHNAQRS